MNWRSFREWFSRLTREEADALLFADTRSGSPAAGAEAFPSSLAFSLSGGRDTVRLPVSYKHDTSAEDDGISCRLAPEDIPLALLFDSSRLVPGALVPFVSWLLKALPRATSSMLAARAGLDPKFSSFDDIARAVAAALPPEGALPGALVETLAARFGIRIPRDTWDASAFPPAWKWRWEVSAGRGETAYSTRSEAELALFAGEYAKIRGTRLPTAFERVFGRDAPPSSVRFVERVRVGTAGERELFAWTSAEIPAKGSGAAVVPVLRRTREEAEAPLRSLASGSRVATRALRAAFRRSPPTPKNGPPRKFSAGPRLSLSRISKARCGAAPPTSGSSPATLPRSRRQLTRWRGNVSKRSNACP